MYKMKTYETLKEVIEQLELLNYQTEDKLHNLSNNAAFKQLKALAHVNNLCLSNVSGSLPCGCLKCSPNVFPNMRFNVCPICGNKRCPHASDHNYECTNSNDVGQTGGVYGGNDR